MNDNMSVLDVVKDLYSNDSNILSSIKTYLILSTDHYLNEIDELEVYKIIILKDEVTMISVVLSNCIIFEFRFKNHKIVSKERIYSQELVR